MRNRLLVQRTLAERYDQVLIPVRQKIVAEALKHYNFMLLGVYRLLEAKQDEVDAYREYIEAKVRDLQGMRDRLLALMERCDDDDASRCPILDAFARF